MASSMKIYQSRSFAKKINKLKKNEKSNLDEEVKRIIKDPTIGTEKKGDLKGIFIHKFKIKTALYLVSYRLVSDGMELITFGTHENYYRDLKSYLKKR